MFPNQIIIIIWKIYYSQIDDALHFPFLENIELLLSQFTMTSITNDTRETYGVLIRNDENESVFRCVTCNFVTADENLIKLHCLEHKGITDLDINCIERICENLLPNDLAAFGQTCKQYKDCTGDTYLSKAFQLFIIIYYQGLTEFQIFAEKLVNRCAYLWEPLKIVVKNPMRFGDQLQFVLKGHKNYAIRFHKFIQFLEIELLFDTDLPDSRRLRELAFPTLHPITQLDFCSIPTRGHMLQLYQFIRDNCAANLKHLTIMSNRDCLLNENIGIIDEQIKDLILLKTKFVRGLEALMKRCTEIKVLIYIPGYTVIPDNTLRGTYPKLDILILPAIWRVSQRLAHFDDFLSANPQLKAVICKNNANTNIQDILRITNKLPFAAIVLTDIIFPKIRDAFATCCKRKNIQSLEVLLAKVEEIVFSDIFKTKYVSGLHCVNFPRFIKISEIPIQTNLKRLCVNIDKKISSQLYELMGRLPECTELRLTGWPNVTIKDLVMSLISRTNKLENIYSDCEAIMDFTTNDAMELNATRSQVNGASKLCIHLNDQTTITDFMGSCVFDLITIRLEREEDLKCFMCSSDHNDNLQFLRMNNIYEM